MSAGRVIAEQLDVQQTYFFVTPAATSGPPTTGTFALGHEWVDSAGDRYICTVAGTPGTWVRQARITDIINTTPRGYIYEYRLTYNSASLVDIGAAGVTSLAVATDGASLITLSGVQTINMATVGANGRDAGSEAANTWYAVFVISGTSGVAGLLSTSPTAPTLPSGYTVFRRVGWVYNDASSNIRQFSRRGNGPSRWVYWTVDRANLLALSAGTATGWTTISLSSFVPSTARDVWLQFGILTVSANVRYFGVKETGSPQTFPNSMSVRSVSLKTTPSKEYDVLPARTNASQQIDYAITNASDSLDLAVFGWVDEL